jgi:hypothetical protein
MAWSVVQHHFTTNNVSPIAPAWSPSTTNGNLLVATLCVVRSDSTSFSTVTAPSGWVLANQNKNVSTPNGQAFNYYILNSPSRSGSESFSFTGTITGCTLDIVELTNPLVTSASLDQAHGGNGTSATPATGTSAALRTSSDVAIACICQAGAVATFSSPTNSYSIEDQGSNTSCTGACLINLAVGTAGTGVAVTSTQNENWSAGLMTFYLSGLLGGDGLPMMGVG